MALKYNFDDNADDFEYDPDVMETQKALVQILCKEVKQKHGKLYDENGAYQMAMYVVHELDMFETLYENLEPELTEYFEEDAKQNYQDTKDNELEEKDWYGTKNKFL